MRHYGRMGLIAAAMGCALVLTACGPMLGALASASDPPASVQPGTYADKTTLDEKAGIAVEVAYQAAALAATGLAREGLVSGDAAARLKSADAKAYAATQKARAAYDAGNARSYRDLEKAATGIIAEFLGLIISKGESP